MGIAYQVDSNRVLARVYEAAKIKMAYAAIMGQREVRT